MALCWVILISLTICAGGLYDDATKYISDYVDGKYKDE